MGTSHCAHLGPKEGAQCRKGHIESCHISIDLNELVSAYQHWIFGYCITP